MQRLDHPVRRLRRARRAGTTAAGLTALSLATTTAIGLRPAYAAEYGYNAATGNWTTAANWTDNLGATGVTPGVSDVAYIGSNFPAGAATTAAVNVTSAVTAGNVEVGFSTGSNGTLNLNAGGSLDVFALSVGFNGTGAVNRNGGLLTARNIALAHGADLAFAATDTITPGGTWNLSGGGTTLSYNHNGAATTIFSVDVDDGAAFTFDGGTLRTEILALGGVFGAGTFTRNGGVLDVGTINVASGSVLSLFPTDVHRGLGTTSVIGTGSVLNFNTTMLSPAGTAFVDTGGILNLQGGSFSANFLQVFGGSVLRDGGLVSILGNLQVSGGSSFTVAAGDTYTGATLSAVGAGTSINLAGNDLTAAGLSIVGGTVTRGGASIDVSTLGVGAGSSFSVEPGDTIAAGGTLSAGAGSTLTINTPIPNTLATAEASNGGVLALNGNTLHASHISLGGSTAGAINRGVGGKLDVKSISLNAGSTLAVLPVDTVNADGQFYIYGTDTVLSYDNASTSEIESVTVIDGATVNLQGGTLHTDVLALGNFTPGVLTRSGGLLDVNGTAMLRAGSTLDVVAGDSFAGSSISVIGAGTQLALHGNDISATGLSLSGGAVTRGTGGNVNLKNLAIDEGSTFSIEPGDSLATDGSILVRQTGSVLDINTPLPNTLNSVNVNNAGTLNLHGNTLRTAFLGLEGATLNRSGATLVLGSATIAGGNTLDLLPTDAVVPGGPFNVFGAGSVINYNNAPSGAMSHADAYDGGVINLQGGTLRTQSFQLGFNTPGSLVRAGGLLHVQSALTLAAGSALNVVTGDSFTGANVLVRDAGSSLNLNGNTLVASTLTLAGGGSISRGGATISVGSFTVSNGSQSALLSGDSAGSVTIDGAGAVLDVQAGPLGASATNVAVVNEGVLNLNGGTLTTNTTGASILGVNGTSTVNFRGATIKITAAPTTALITGITNAVVGSGGGVRVDTNGFDAAISLPLVHDATLGATPDGGLTKLGAGTLQLSTASTYTGGTTVSGGTLLLTNADATGGGAIDVKDGAVARTQPSLPKAVTVSTLTTNASGKFDLADNSMVVKGMAAAAVRAEIAKAFNGGKWNGPAGLTSSTAAAAIPKVTAIGYATNGTPLTTLTEFKGVTGLTATDVLVKYTYYGDSNLSGTTTLADFTLFVGGLQGGGTTWAQGDYDYSGGVTLDDFSLFLLGYQQQGAALSELASEINSSSLGAGERAALLAAVQAVPEPAGLAAVALAGLGLARRSRRKLGR